MPSLISYAGGAEHPPEGDIQAIRDLLKGYGSDHSLLKELIQNAEDAESTRLCLNLHPGWSDAPHSLLKTPGLQVINNGRFTEQDLRSMRRFGLGTKGSDSRAIGRFGKGLKSVFSVCEAFFITAKTRSEDWERNSDVCNLFSPWERWRHADWLNDFPEKDAQIFDAIAQSAAGFNNPHWLCLWLPLRHSKHHEPNATWIYEDDNFLPGEDSKYGQRLITALRYLAPHLATLRVLKEVVIKDAQTGKGAVWRNNDGQRRSSPELCTTETETVSGTMVWTDEACENSIITYQGRFAKIESPEILKLKQHRDWPKVVVPSIINADSVDVPAKGEPHCGALITARPKPTGQAPGSLTVNWAVFLPVGNQPGDHAAPLPSLAFDLNLEVAPNRRTRVEPLKKVSTDERNQADRNEATQT